MNSASRGNIVARGYRLTQKKEITSHSCLGIFAAMTYQPNKLAKLVLVEQWLPHPELRRKNGVMSSFLDSLI